MSQMLSNEPGSVSYSKLVRIDVVRCPRPIPEGGERMNLIELSIKMSKTAPAKACLFHTDWKKCCIFQEEEKRSHP